MRKWVRYGLILLAALSVGAVVLLLVTYKAAQHQPEFYREAIQSAPAPEVQAEAGDALEREVLDLRNSVKRSGHWEARFTDEQINGWLAVDLPEKFPNVLPKQINDPRVSITPGEALLGARYEDTRITTVVSLALDISLSDEPNVIAVRIKKARAGAIPAPITSWLDKVTVEAAKAGIEIRWVQVEGDPVAMVTLPTNHKEMDKRILSLERLDLLEGEVVLAGKTTKQTPDSELNHTADQSSWNIKIVR